MLKPRYFALKCAEDSGYIEKTMSNIISAYDIILYIYRAAYSSYQILNINCIETVADGSPLKFFAGSFTSIQVDPISVHEKFVDEKYHMSEKLCSIANCANFEITGDGSTADSCRCNSCFDGYTSISMMYVMHASCLSKCAVSANSFSMPFLFDPKYWRPKYNADVT